jgi:capsular exopolysaccharide synthesis family protein
MLTIMVMSLFSISVGIIIVFGLDRLDNAVRSAEDAEDISGLPTLAIMPLVDQQSLNPFRELEENPRSALADAARSLRVALDLGRTENKPKIIVITSSVPKESKTFTASCLAGLFCRTDKRVLLIDADLHRPRLHGMFNHPGDIGLAQILSGQVVAANAIARNVLTNLDFLAAGRMENVADLITEASFRAALDQLIAHYDRIVIDCPPVLAIPDPRIIARFADRLLYLVKWRETPRDAVANGLKLLMESGAKVDGIVLTQVNQKKYARYAYGDYGSYYGRYRDYYTQ